MTINLENEAAIQLDLNYKELLEQVTSAALDYEGCPYEAEINVLLTNNEEIEQINQEYRQINRPTDVLSFPMLEYEIPADFSFLEEEPLDCFNPDSGELLLGDIIISLDKVKEQAEQYGHSIRREFAFLVVHSILHLCGYDHMEEKERQVMEQRQNKILEDLSILR